MYVGATDSGTGVPGVGVLVPVPPRVVRDLCGREDEDIGAGDEVVDHWWTFFIYAVF